MKNKTMRLWEIVEKENIKVFYRDINNTPEKLNGLYIYHQEIGPVIILDKGLLSKRREHTEILSEEVGHHLAGVRTNVLFANQDYSTRIERNRDEHRAMVWATDFLIPDQELEHAVKDIGCRSCYELADYFDVTQKFFMAKLVILKQCFRRTGLKVKGRDILQFDLSSCF